ncbi:MAG TPA: anti-sigma factor [Trueperaceae bacterium]
MTIDEALLIDYALGTVSSEQAREVESFLRVDSEAARRVRRIQDDLSWLVMTLPPARTDERSVELLVERLRASPIPPRSHDRLTRGAAKRSSRWAAFGIAVALGVAAWLVLGPLLRPDRVERLVERYQARPGALSSRLIDEDGRELGTLVRLPDGRLFVAFDERPPEGVYQLWALREDGPFSLAVVEGRTMLTEPVTEASSLAITLEPVGGSEHPSAPLLVEDL